MERKHYRCGVILGRFQPLHRGHARVMEQALAACDKVVVLIGSSQESRTARNPFSYEERASFIRDVFNSRILTVPLKDLGIGDVNGWGEYIISEAEKEAGPVDAFFLGSEEKNAKWFTKERREKIDIVQFDRLEINISATEVREHLHKGEKEEFLACMPEPLGLRYEEMKRVIESVCANGK